MEDNQSEFFAEVLQTVKQNFYMVICLKSSATEEATIQVIRDLVTLSQKYLSFIDFDRNSVTGFVIPARSTNNCFKLLLKLICYGFSNFETLDDSSITIRTISKQTQLRKFGVGPDQV